MLSVFLILLQDTIIFFEKKAEEYHTLENTPVFKINDNFGYKMGQFYIALFLLTLMVFRAKNISIIMNPGNFNIVCVTNHQWYY